MKWVLTIICAIAITNCSYIHKTARPLPERCTNVDTFKFTHKEVKILSRFITEHNRMNWLVDIRRHDVCLQEVITQNHLGLIRIESAVSSHWVSQYFIKGSTGVSTINLAQSIEVTKANVKAALDQHGGDFSSEEQGRIISYFEHH
ncbi:hypothetical protein HER32_09295 [Hymenobacter sp. BT18]|uniref:hypothetical protein n=1 Tax=Hymenobacter sp. BT18 TaxID=2835648 RepID=UPI00143EBC1F|nr:hypothetical protein [Hymenobacter sp. BT18]QIX61361.1 hypothetical protein HER32_09295 [Hymenobacter sp. BT18]